MTLLWFFLPAPLVVFPRPLRNSSFPLSPAGHFGIPPDQCRPLTAFFSLCPRVLVNALSLAHYRHLRAETPWAVHDVIGISAKWPV